MVVNEQGNSGDIEEGTAKPDNDAWIYSNNQFGPCKLTFSLKDKDLVVKQDGLCGFGLNVFANGTYKKVSPPPELGQGTYASENGSLTVEAPAMTNTLQFTLLVVNDQGNSGELHHEMAIARMGVWTYTNPEADCVIEFRPNGNVVALKQTGLCGFGLNVFADGSYRKK